MKPGTPQDMMKIVGSFRKRLEPPTTDEGFGQSIVWSPSRMQRLYSDNLAVIWKMATEHDNNAYRNYKMYTYTYSCV